MSGDAERVESLVSIDEEKARMTAELLREEIERQLGSVAAKVAAFETIAALQAAKTNVDESRRRIDELHDMIIGTREDVDND